MIKQCVQCHCDITKPLTESKKRWEKRRFCSRACKAKSQKGKPFHSPFGNISRRGSKHTEESRAKMSKSHTGKIRGPHSLEHRLKISQAQKGPKGYWFGKEMPEEIRAKMSKSNTNKCGKENSNWRGGETPSDKLIRNSSKYKAWRKTILKRDNHTCLVCKERKEKMQVHHKKAFVRIVRENNILSVEEADKCEELWYLENGITICRSCHNVYHSINGK